MTRHEIEALAAKRFGYPASITKSTTRLDGTPTEWLMLSILKSTGAREIIGLRRSLDELPALIERGPAMEAIKPARDSRLMV